MVLTIDDKEPTTCDECNDSLVGKGYYCFNTKDGKEVSICLTCATIKALKYEYPFDKDIPYDELANMRRINQSRR